MVATDNGSTTEVVTETGARVGEDGKTGFGSNIAGGEDGTGGVIGPHRGVTRPGAKAAREGKLTPGSEVDPETKVCPEADTPSLVVEVIAGGEDMLG